MNSATNSVAGSNAENLSIRANAHEQHASVGTILSYLDSVEAPSCVKYEKEIDQIEPDHVKKVVLEREHSTDMLNRIKGQLLELKLEVKQKTTMLDSLRNSQQQQNEELVQQYEAEKSALNLKLQQQKDEYDNVLKRQFEFVDKLLQDKTNLTEKADTLMKEMETQKLKFRDMVSNRDKVWATKLEKMKLSWNEREKTERKIWAHEKQSLLRANVMEATELRIANINKAHAKEKREMEQRYEVGESPKRIARCIDV